MQFFLILWRPSIRSSSKFAYQAHGCPEKFPPLQQDYFSCHESTAICTTQKTPEVFNVCSGVPQGSVLSLLLFLNRLYAHDCDILHNQLSLQLSKTKHQARQRTSLILPPGDLTCSVISTNRFFWKQGRVSVLVHIIGQEALQVQLCHDWNGHKMDPFKIDTTHNSAP